MSLPKARFPSSVFSRGQEPDARFTLANERTFLAWMGAALALLTVGVGLDALAVALHPTLRKVSAALLVVDSVLCSIHAWFGWVRTERALRENRPLPGPGFSLWLAASVSLVAVLLLAALVIS